MVRVDVMGSVNPNHNPIESTSLLPTLTGTLIRTLIPNLP